MQNNQEQRIEKLELTMAKLAQANQLTNEVLFELPDNLKVQIKQEVDTRLKEIESNVVTTVGDTIDKKVEETIKTVFDERGLSKIDADRLTKARQKRMRELLGDSKSDRYKIYIKFYQGNMRNQYLKKFDVMRYADIEPSQFTEALNFIQNFNIVDDSWCTKLLHEEYRNDEFPNNKLKHAYERYFNITA